MRTGIFKRCCTIGIATTFLFSCTNQEMVKPDQSIDDAEKASVNYEISIDNPTYTLTPDAAGRLSAITGDAAMAKAATGGFDVTWDTATARLREIRFDAKRGKDEVEFKLKTDRQIDLKKAPAFIGAIQIPKGTYQQVKVFVLAEGDKKDPAVRFKGFLTWDGKKIPMEIQLAGKIELSANGKDVVVSDTGIDWKGSLKISMDMVLTKLQIGDFTGSFANGKLFISVDVNTNLHDKVKGALENSMSVEHSHN
ncbi:hypothetical protein DVR12_25875 [Chitinophaga silvatica]|uniref:DUF4382 domain-containing protein n=1 Tax=Chitinophaga silvatica TaxID=2282649 RepID=A0A3E1Y2Z2_9BACT|nr:hypothetical protein [Chitinophaga silvatica]RFS19032.1 hypothetical protein DVR12_25875 [Chitinophaga silvatica]